MGTRIYTNVDSLRGLYALSKANQLQSQTLTRLSTGTQINSAADNPSGLIASNTLQTQITSIQQSISNSNLANNVIGTADSALGEVGNLLDQIRGLVQEGVNSGALSSTEISANQSQIDAALGAINRIAGNTSFAGQKLLDGSKAFTTTVSSADQAKLSDFQVNEALFGSSSTVTLDAQVISAAKKGTLTYNSGNLNQATTIEVAGSKGSQVLFFGTGSTYTNINSAINAVSDVTGVTSSITTAAVASKATIGGGGEAIVSGDEKASIGGSVAAATTLGGGGEGLLNGNETATIGTGTSAVNITATRGAADGSNPVTVSFVAGGATAARPIAITGNAIVVTLATTGGVVNGSETASSLATYLTSNSSGLVTANASQGGAGVVAAAAPTTLADSNSGIKFVANRGTSDGAHPISVQYVAGTATAARSVSVTGNAITVTLATTNGVVNASETASSVASFINTDSSAGAQAARGLVTAFAGTGVDGTGAGVLAAKAATNLAGSSANSGLKYTDARTGAAANGTPISIKYVSGTASQALSVSVTGSAITVNLATDSSGQSTTTANQLASFIQTDSSAGAIAARALVTTTAGDSTTGLGDGTGVVSSNGPTVTLTGGADATVNVTATRATADGAHPVSVSFVAGSGTATRSVNVTGNSVVVTLATTNGVVNNTETASSISSYLTANSGGLVTATSSNGGAGIVAPTSSTNLTDSNDGIKFVAKRGTADGTNPITVNYVAGTGTAARSVAVSGNAITVTLATTNGVVNSTETANSVASFINTDTSTGAVAARGLVTAFSGTGIDGDGTGVLSAKSAPTTLTGSSANSGLKFVDARQDAGASDTPVTVQYVAGTANQALSVSVTGSAITVNLATDATGQSTTTANALASFIQTDTSAGAVSARALVTTTAADGTAGLGDGTGVVTATGAATSLTGGSDAVLTLSSSDYGSSQFASINVLNGAFATNDETGALSNRDAGSDIQARINGQTALGDGLKASVSTALLSGSVSFNEANNNALAEAKVTVTGGGSLFQIGADVSVAGQVGIGIDGVNTARLGGVSGKLYELGSGGGKSLLDVGSQVQGAQLVDIITQAADKVNDLRSRLGALQKDVINTNISSLSVALTNISDAKSQISDTDFAVETANLTKSQILNQAGISTLQIANSAPQQVLTLLRQ